MSHIMCSSAKLDPRFCQTSGNAVGVTGSSKMEPFCRLSHLQQQVSSCKYLLIHSSNGLPSTFIPTYIAELIGRLKKNAPCF